MLCQRILTFHYLLQESKLISQRNIVWKLFFSAQTPGRCVTSSSIRKQGKRYVRVAIDGIASIVGCAK